MGKDEGAVGQRWAWATRLSLSPDSEIEHDAAVQAKGKFALGIHRRICRTASAVSRALRATEPTGAATSRTRDERMIRNTKARAGDKREYDRHD